MKLRVLFWGCIALFSFDHVEGHGRLIDPPSRSTMWRFGYDTPHNYDDNQLFCGGFTRQVNNGYKCGVCGDPWDGPRKNEAGGKYATGIIVNEYEIGSVIPIKVQITAHHKGWFEFKLCPNNNVEKAATQECLDRHPLHLADGKGTKYYVPNEGAKTYKVRVKLPPNLSCSQCVLQWRYHTGNSWGVDADTGRGCVGCGMQEEFYGCADIAVKYFGTDLSTAPPDDSKSETKSTRNPNEQLSTTDNAIEISTLGKSTWTTVPTTTQPAQEKLTTPQPTSYTKTITPTTTQPAQEKLTTQPTSHQTTSPSRMDIICRGVAPYDRQPGIDDWCNVNCPRFCPNTHCRCKKIGRIRPGGGRKKKCRPVGSFSKVRNAKGWCRRNCNHTPPFCPATHCNCSD